MEDSVLTKDEIGFLVDLYHEDKLPTELFIDLLEHNHQKWLLLESNKNSSVSEDPSV